MKASEIFEGENSSLRKTFESLKQNAMMDEAIASAELAGANPTTTDMPRGKKQKEKLYTVQPQTIFVCAGNYKQFIEWVRPRQAEGLTFVYADSPHRIMGYRPTRVIEIGTFSLRPEAYKIRELIERNNSWLFLPPHSQYERM